MVCRVVLTSTLYDSCFHDEGQSDNAKRGDAFWQLNILLLGDKGTIFFYASKKNVLSQWLFVIFSITLAAIKYIIMRYIYVMGCVLMLLPQLLRAGEPFVFTTAWTAQAEFAGYYVAKEKGFYRHFQKYQGQGTKDPLQILLELPVSTLSAARDLQRLLPRPSNLRMRRIRQFCTLP